MKNTNTAAAIALALGMVISSCILYLAIGSLGQSIGQAASYPQPDPVRIPDRLYLHPTGPWILRLENSPVGSSLKIETSDKDPRKSD
jgi:hypothetical protein